MFAHLYVTSDASYWKKSRNSSIRIQFIVPSSVLIPFFRYWNLQILFHARWLKEEQRNTLRSPKWNIGKLWACRYRQSWELRYDPPFLWQTIKIWKAVPPDPHCLWHAYLLCFSKSTDFLCYLTSWDAAVWKNWWRNYHMLLRYCTSVWALYWFIN